MPIENAQLTREQVKKIADDINHQLNYNGAFAWLEPYLHDSEWGEDWRIRIMDRNKQPVCDCLQPDKLDWHTVKMLLLARVEHGEAEFARGKVHAVNKLCEHFKGIVK